MGAAHSASAEVRELVGKTGCEYPGGARARGRGRGRRARGSAARAVRLASRRWLCDLGRVAGPLCASVSPTCKRVPAGSRAGCGEGPRGDAGEVPGPLTLTALEVGRSPRGAGTADPGGSGAGAPLARGGRPCGVSERPATPRGRAPRTRKSPGFALRRRPESFEVGGGRGGAGLWLRPICEMGSGGRTSRGSGRGALRGSPATFLELAAPPGPQRRADRAPQVTPGTVRPSPAGPDT